MAEDKTIYYFRWMNRTRYKDKAGKLIIKSGGEYPDRAAALKKFAAYTEQGYAVQLNSAPVRMVETLNLGSGKTEMRSMRFAATPIIENERWIARIREATVTKLKRQISARELELESMKDKLKEMEAQG